MASSIIENIVMRICGRYIKNFKKENIDIGVSGTVQLNNVHLRTDELGVFLLPYKPVQAFIGSLFGDFPIMLNGNLVVKISDVLLVFTGSPSYDQEVDMVIVQRALQAWLGTFYFSLASSIEQAEKKTLISTSQIDSTQKSFEKLQVTIENIHIRIEEQCNPTNSHIIPHNPSLQKSENEVMYISYKLGKLEFRSPNTKDIENDDIWKSSTSTWFRRDSSMSNIKESDLSVELLRKLYSQKRKFKIIGPCETVIKLCANFQRGTQIFSPVSQLQRRARVLCNGSGNVTVKAQLRWQMIRDKVRSEWSRWMGSGRVTGGGTIRWRGWFEVWRTAARYVALREILMYHVGFAMQSNSNSADSSGSNSSEQQSQSLNTYYSKGDFSRKLIKAAETLLSQPVRALYALQLEMDCTLPPRVIAYCRIWAEEKYRLRTVAAAVTAAAISAVTESQGGVMSDTSGSGGGGSGGGSSSGGSGGGITESIDGSGEGNGDGNQVLGGGYLLLAVVDAQNIRGVLGMSKVDVYCSLRFRDWDGARQHVVTDVQTSFVSSDTGTASIYWGEIFQVPLPVTTPVTTPVTVSTTPTKNKSSTTSTTIPIIPTLKMDCKDKGIITSLLGSIIIPSTQFISSPSQQQQTSAASTSTNSNSNGNSSGEEVEDGIIHTFYCTMNRKVASSYISESPDNNNSNSNSNNNTSNNNSKSNENNNSNDDVQVRIMSLIVRPNKTTPTSTSTSTNRSLHQSLLYLKTKVNESIQITKDAMEQKRQRAIHEGLKKITKGGGGDGGDIYNDDENAFILDPTQLTVQDIKVIIPQMNITVCGTITTPTTTTPTTTSSTTTTSPVRHTANTITKLSSTTTQTTIPVTPISVTPVSVSVSHRVPVLCVRWGRIKGVLTAKNNPWDIQLTGSIRGFQIYNLQQHLAPEKTNFNEARNNTNTSISNSGDSRDGSSNSKKGSMRWGVRGSSGVVQVVQESTPLLTLPYISAQLVVSQTSSTGRYIGSIQMFPFKFNFKPKPSYNTTATTSSSSSHSTHKQLWRASNILEHLFSDKTLWGLSTGFQSMSMMSKEGMEGGSREASRSHLEASIRLGDTYDIYPLQYNILKEIWYSIKRDKESSNKSPQLSGTSEPSSTSSTLLLSQTTLLQLFTEMRSFGIEISLECNDNNNNRNNDMNMNSIDNNYNNNNNEEEEEEEDDNNWDVQYDVVDDNNNNNDDDDVPFSDSKGTCFDDNSHNKYTKSTHNNNSNSNSSKISVISNKNKDDSITSTTATTPSTSTSTSSYSFMSVFGGGSSRKKQNDKKDTNVYIQKSSTTPGTGASTVIGTGVKGNVVKGTGVTDNEMDSETETEREKALKKAWNDERMKLLAKISSLEQRKSELEDRVLALSRG
eukprot:gene6261-12675_t